MKNMTELIDILNVPDVFHDILEELKRIADALEGERCRYRRGTECTYFASARKSEEHERDSKDS